MRPKVYGKRATESLPLPADDGGSERGDDDEGKAGGGGEEAGGEGVHRFPFRQFVDPAATSARGARWLIPPSGEAPVFER